VAERTHPRADDDQTKHRFQSSAAWFFLLEDPRAGEFCSTGKLSQEKMRKKRAVSVQKSFWKDGAKSPKKQSVKTHVL